jgi:hypothetical protein
MRAHSVLTPFVLALALPSAPAQEAVVQKVIELERTDSRVMEHLDHLVNRIGPRLTGSDGYDNACAWTLAQFREFGLQNCRLEPWGEVAVGFNRGPAWGRVLAPERKELHFATDAWTAGTKGPTAGLALLAPATEEDLEAARPKLAGAWVLIAPTPPRSAPSPTAGSGPGAAPQERAPARPSRELRERIEKAYAEAGIAGTIRSGRGDLLLTGGSQRVAFDKLPARPSITLLAAEHKELCDRVKAGEEVRLEFDIRNWFEQGPIPQNNVIAELPGAEKPDEVVIVGGHLDSWDGATGTTDDGTGVATTLEAARLLVKAGAKPKRTIRFMLWGGEEQGLLGSRAWVQKHKDELPRISAVLVHDEGTNYCAAIPATPQMKPLLEPIFAPVVNLDPELPFRVHEVKGLPGGGSDHDSFLAANVPGLFWEQKGRANYNHTHHTQFDTFDAAIPQYQRNSAVVIAVGALGIANLPDLLPRDNLRAPPGGGFGGRRLGVQLADDMTIDELVEGGLAEKAGVHAGDKVLRIGDKAVADRDELRTAMQEAPAKTKVVVLRAGKELEFPIEFPPDAGPGGGLTRRLGLRFGEGLNVESVTEGSPAEKAGFKPGDVVAKVSDTAVEALPDLFRALGGLTGDVKVVVRRAGADVPLTVALPERP